MKQLSLFDDELYSSIRQILERSERPRLGAQASPAKGKAPPDPRAYWLAGRLLGLEAKVSKEGVSRAARELSRRLKGDFGSRYSAGCGWFVENSRPVLWFHPASGHWRGKWPCCTQRL